MTQTFKNLSSVLLAMVMLLSLSMTTFAADSTITFMGRSQGFSFKPGSEYTATDLFDNFKDVMPGDKLTEIIQIKNEAADCDYIKLYMRAVAHDENGNPLTYSEAFEQLDGKDQSGENQTPVDGQRDETVATMQDFLAQLSMKVYNGETLLYEASPEELGGLHTNVYLASLRKGESAKLTVELSVPISLGNEYANRVGEVDWVFLAEGLDDPKPPQNTPSSEQPGKKPGPSPKTGDSSPILLYSVIVFITGSVLIVLLVLKVRNNKRIAQRKEEYFEQ